LLHPAVRHIPIKKILPSSTQSCGRQPRVDVSRSSATLRDIEKRVFSVTIFNCKKPYLGLLVAGSLGIIPEDHVAENGNARSD
jgi:hypothetical protein